MVDRTLTLYQEDGKEIVCDILFTYFYEKTQKNYVVFQVRETQEVSAATYDEKSGSEGKLGLIETEEEWSMLEELLTDYSNQLDEEACGGSCASCGGSCGSCDCDGDCDGDCE